MIHHYYEVIFLDCGIRMNILMLTSMRSVFMDVLAQNHHDEVIFCDCDITMNTMMCPHYDAIIVDCEVIKNSIIPPLWGHNLSFWHHIGHYDTAMRTWLVIAASQWTFWCISLWVIIQICGHHYRHYVAHYYKIIFQHCDFTMYFPMFNHYEDIIIVAGTGISNQSQQDVEQAP